MTTNTETNDKAPTGGAQGEPVAPQKRSSKKGASGRKGAPKPPIAAKNVKPKAAVRKGAEANKKAAKPEKAKKAGQRAESKGAKILEMIGRAKGAPLAEIMKATQWQAHSVRGFLSVAAKKHHLKIEVHEKRRRRPRLQNPQVGRFPS